MNKNADRIVQNTQLWAGAAGRCQFNGCNRPLYKSPVTEEQGNISEIAHIWSFSDSGPRGWGPFASDTVAINDLPNLMLLCHDCHKIIDADKYGFKYSAKLLRHWKEEHEKRVAIVCGVKPGLKSHVVLFGGNIGDNVSPLQPEHAKEVLFPKMYPADERPIRLSMKWDGRDDQADYWETEAANLETSFNRQVRPLIEDSDQNHFSIFALAPIPLLIKLGSIFTDKTPTDVFQLHREPAMSWRWLPESGAVQFLVNRPADITHPPSLVISLSDSICHERVYSVLGKEISIWELTIASPHNDFLKSPSQLSAFREVSRRLIAEIGRTHGLKLPLSIFPAMPVACAVELGRIRMPKAVMPWIIYDQNSRKNSFVRTLQIGGSHE